MTSITSSMFLDGGSYKGLPSRFKERECPQPPDLVGRIAVTLATQIMWVQLRGRLWKIKLTTLLCVIVVRHFNSLFVKNATVFLRMSFIFMYLLFHSSFLFVDPNFHCFDLFCFVFLCKENTRLYWNNSHTFALLLPFLEPSSPC